jgi:hypothetical protein
VFGVVLREMRDRRSRWAVEQRRLVQAVGRSYLAALVPAHRCSSGPSDAAEIVLIAFSTVAGRFDDVDHLRRCLIRAVTTRLASGFQCAR